MLPETPNVLRLPELENRSLIGEGWEMSALANSAFILAESLRSPSTVSYIYETSKEKLNSVFSNIDGNPPLNAEQIDTILTSFSTNDEGKAKALQALIQTKGHQDVDMKTVDALVKQLSKTSLKATVDPKFKLIFLSVLTITILCGVGDIIMALIWSAPTPNQQSTFDALGFAWKAGVGAIFGLLGGKVS